MSDKLRDAIDHIQDKLDAGELIDYTDDEELKATKFLKEVWWILSKGLGLAFIRWAEGVSADSNAYRPVSKIKNTPVSGDALAWYSKEWREFDDGRRVGRTGSACGAYPRSEEDDYRSTRTGGRDCATLGVGG